MKFIIINDIFNFYKKNIKIILMYLISFVVYIIFSLSMFSYSENYNIFYKALGLKLNYEFASDLLMFGINIAFYIFVFFSIFLSDFKNGITNIFSRLKKKNYVIYKFISLFLIIIINKMLYYVLGSILCKFNYINLQYYLLDIFSTIMFYLPLIICYMLLCNYKFNWFIIYLFSYITTGFINIDYYSIINYNFYIVLPICLIIIFVYIYFSQLIIKVYERSR